MPAPRAAKSDNPTPKVAAGGAAGAVTVVIVYVASLLGVEFPPEVASAFTVLISFGASYAKSE